MDIKEQTDEFKLVRILNKYFDDCLLEYLSECANEIMQAGYLPIQADSEGLVKIVSPCEICEYNCPQEKKGICVTYRDYTNKMQLLKAQKSLCDKEKEEAVKKVGDKIRKFDKGEGWIELGEADLADIIKQTLEVSK